MAKLKTSEDWKSVLSDMWASPDTGEPMKNARVMDALHKKLVYQEAQILNRILASVAQQHGYRALSATEQDMLVLILSSGIRGLRREVYDLNDPHDVKVAVQLLADMVVKC